MGSTRGCRKTRRADTGEFCVQSGTGHNMRGETTHAVWNIVRYGHRTVGTRKVQKKLKGFVLCHPISVQSGQGDWRRIYVP